MYLVLSVGNIMNLFFAALLVCMLNLPFGYWRSGTKRFSFQWFAAVHIPVPFVIGLRILFDLVWKLDTFPIMIGAFFMGQYLGGKIRSIRERSKENKLS
jgi:hypothetical protein